MNSQMNNASFYVNETNPEKLRKALTDALDEAGFSVLQFTEYHFEPHGWTALWLLGESHLAVHTFPENEHSYVELTSCVPAPYWHFLRIIIDLNYH